MNDFGLRERKYAATKAALMQAVIAHLGAQTLDEIAVKEVCREVQVSETTFFNYFPSKQDVIFYFVQVWSIAVAWEMTQAQDAHGNHLDALRQMFRLTGEKDAEMPGIFTEIVALQARVQSIPMTTPLTPAEYAHHFPDSPGIETLQPQGIETLIAEKLIAAQKAGELRAETDVQALTMTLISVFFITPVMVRFGLARDTASAYARQLDALLG